MKIIFTVLMGIFMLSAPIIASADYYPNTYNQRCTQLQSDNLYSQLPAGQSYDPSIQGYETNPYCTNYSQSPPSTQQSVIINNYLQPTTIAQPQLPPPAPKKPSFLNQIAQGLILSKIFNFPVAFNFGL